MLSILRKYWGYDNFRGIQRDIIQSIAEGHDTLGLMPTGGGKSITFQVPALSMPGICLVITPLISLMKDQVDNLRRRGILAHAIYSGVAHNDIVKILDNCIYGDIKFLYVSPERLSSSLFLTKLKHIRISFITVDEAHCISQWGYDFRPAYLQISQLRNYLPGKAILALTATATPAVVEDIQKQLDFKQGKVFRMSFRRANISYIVRHADDIVGETIHILNSVQGSAIIYTMSRQRTKDISRKLQTVGIDATYYHAGLDIAVKLKRQQDWQNGTTRVIVATNAFGMGIDKPDVRLVIHVDVPSSIEAYFQEAGRAGRDGKRSYAVLLKNNHTTTILKSRIKKSFPAKQFIRDVYEHLAYYYEIGVGMGRDLTFVLPLQHFCSMYKYSVYQTDAALSILSNAGYICYDKDPDDHTRLTFIVGRDDLYLLNQLTTEEEQLIDNMMRHYSGLFSEYVWIDERTLADLQGITPQRIYMLLSELRRKRIIKFVPPRTEPRITYLVPRVDGDDVKLVDAVYDNLLKIMEDHIDDIIAYINNEDVCRQTQLVNYFGEKSDEDCGCCEICLQNRKVDNESKMVDIVMQKIIELLSDKRIHNTYELRDLTYNRDHIAKALTILIEDNKIGSDSITIWLKC